MAKKAFSFEDLQYVMPRDLKQQFFIEEIREVREEIPEQLHTEPEHEHCSSCGRTSEEIYLLPLLFKGSNRWVCLRCLKRVLSPEQPKQKEVASYISSSMSESSSEASTEQIIPESGNPMSIFD